MDNQREECSGGRKQAHHNLRQRESGSLSVRERDTKSNDCWQHKPKLDLLSLYYISLLNN